MEAKIVDFKEKTLVGQSLQMSLADNKTPQLWRSFMPNKSLVKDTIGTDLYSIQVYDKDLDFRDFTPHTILTKHTKIEVSSIDTVPESMDVLVIPDGLYAVFTHKGKAEHFASTFRDIMTQWLPQSKYQLDNRPHFELLSDKYINNSDDSEEEVYLPIKLK